MKLRLTKTTLFLVLIFAVAFFLRIIAASHVLIGPDELIYSTIPINIISAGRLSTVEQSPIYFYLVDIFYQIFGVTPISTRLPSILFGSLCVFLIFLIVYEIFNDRRAGLWAAFLYALSGYLIRYNYEMDPTAFFFLLLSIFFFLKGMYTKKQYFYLSALFLGIGILVKQLVIFVAPAYFFLIVYHSITLKESTLVEKTEAGNKFYWGIIYVFIICVGIILITLAPIFVYNYLLYKDQGVTDYYFSNVLGLGKTVHPSYVLGKSWAFDRLINITKSKLLQFLQFDGLLLFLGLVGIYFAHKKWAQAFFLILLFLPLLLYLGGTTGSNSHYNLVLITLAIFGGLTLSLVNEYGQKHINPRIGSFVVTVLLISSLFFIGVDILFERSASLSLRSYVIKNIPDDAVVLLDPRIYNGLVAWAFNDKHYTGSNDFLKFQDASFKSTKPKKRFRVYYVECNNQSTQKTCMWSNEDYARILNFSIGLSNNFAANGKQVGEVRGPDFVFSVYTAQFDLFPQAADYFDQTHNFWFYPVGWKYPERAVDNYIPSGFGHILNAFGFLILYFNFFIVLLSPLLCIYLIFYQNFSYSDNHPIIDAPSPPKHVP